MNVVPTQRADLNLAAGVQPAVQAGTAENATKAGQQSSQWSWADAGLWAVACSGFALSYSSVQKAALSHVDHEALSYLLPVATDGGALAAAARYVADRRAGVAGARGWQLLAWAAIAASAALNAMGRDWQDAVWHLVGPGALAVITELYAHRAARLRKNEADGARESIPARLWVTSPRSSFRLWLWTARTGQRSLVEARRSMDRYAAARQALEIACRSRADRRIRDLARDQLRSGVLDSAAVLQVLGWDTGQAPKDAAAALRVLLATAPGLTATADQAPAEGGPAPKVEVHVIDRQAIQAEPHPAEPHPVERPGLESAPVAPQRPGRARRSQAGVWAAAPRPVVGNSKHAVIDEALAAIGIGPQVTAPAVLAWLARERPEISVGASTIRARLAAVRAEAGAEPVRSGAEAGAEPDAERSKVSAEAGAERSEAGAEAGAEVGAEPVRSGAEVSGMPGQTSIDDALAQAEPEPAEDDAAVATADVDQAPESTETEATAEGEPQAEPSGGRRGLVVVA